MKCAYWTERDSISERKITPRTASFVELAEEQQTGFRELTSIAVDTRQRDVDRHDTGCGWPTLPAATVDRQVTGARTCGESSIINFIEFLAQIVARSPSFLPRSLCSNQRYYSKILSLRLVTSGATIETFGLSIATKNKTPRLEVN